MFLFYSLWKNIFINVYKATLILPAIIWEKEMVIGNSVYMYPYVCMCGCVSLCVCCLILRLTWFLFFFSWPVTKSNESTSAYFELHWEHLWLVISLVKVICHWLNLQYTGVSNENHSLKSGIFLILDPNSLYLPLYLLPFIDLQNS